MKLLLVTVVEQFEEDIIKLFKAVNIESYSESHIDGYKNPASVYMTSSWFPSDSTGVRTSLFFSFTSEDKIEPLFELIRVFNENLDTANPIKAVVVPIEKHI